MIHVQPIIAFDRSSFHRASYVPPASRQPKPATPIIYGFDRAAIMRAAWAHYHTRRTGVFALGDETGHRHFIRSIFAKALSVAWAEAKKRADTERRLAAAMTDHMAMIAALSNPKLTGSAAKVRIAEIENELRVIEFSDAWAIPTGDRVRSLRAELAALEADGRTI